MSTKIYNAFIFDRVPTLYQLRVMIDQLRTEAQVVLDRLHLKCIADGCAHIIDSVALGDGKPVPEAGNRQLYYHVLSQIAARNKKVQATSERDTQHDFSFSLCVTPIKGKLLLQAFTERKELIEVLINKSYLRDYSYWNNTDPDEDCTEKEWKQREADWDEALGESGIPSQSGFLIDLHKPYLRVPPMDQVLKHVPSWSQRVKEWGFELAWREMIRRESMRLKANMKKDWFREACDASRKVKETPEGKKLLQQMIKRVKRKIPRRITKKHLSLDLKGD